MWVKCTVCGEDTYVSPGHEDNSSAHVCPTCRQTARRRTKARRDRLFMIVTALVLIGPMIYLLTQGGAQSIQLCWGGLLLLGVAFYFTWRSRTQG
jgi:hypothetical protein